MPAQPKRTTHRDRVLSVLEGSTIRMVPNVAGNEMENTLFDRNNVRVGTVTFNSKTEFMGGTFYGKMVVTGRTTNSAAALAQFELKIEEMYVKR